MTALDEAGLKFRVGQAFEGRFGSAPEAVAFAPGRVNLLGEHTDYNGGFVLPMPLRLGVAVAVDRKAPAGTVRIESDSFDGADTRGIDEGATGAWSDYVLGSLKAVAGSEIAKSGVRAVIASNLPVGAGLSSSAAIEVGTMRAACALVGKEIEPAELARLARAVENDFVGMPCGIMDQFAVSVGTPGNALFLDTRLLESKRVPLPDGFSFLVIHSGVSHKLTDDGYAVRVKECRAACESLGVKSLSDLGTDDLERISSIDPPLNKRARHIVTENQRVADGVRALEAGEPQRFAALMIASHESQRDDYEVSVPEVDALVEGALGAGAVGARLTGGGFGGSVVALVADDHVPTVSEELERGFPKARVLART